MHRLDIFLSEELAISRSQVQKIISSGLLHINGELPKKAGQTVHAGDKLVISEKLIEKKPAPARVGQKRALRIAALLHGLALLALYVLWRTDLYSPVALWWLIGVGVLFIWQHAVAERDPAFAFFQLNGVLGFLVLGLVLAGMR